jgi:hypothetical protein
MFACINSNDIANVVETFRRNVSQYGLVKARDAINRRLYKGLLIVKTAIYRVFVIYNFPQKILSEPDWNVSTMCD